MTLFYASLFLFMLSELQFLHQQNIDLQFSMVVFFQRLSEIKKIKMYWILTVH